MSLKQSLETLDGLNEALHQLYTKQEDGRFYLDVDGLPEMSVALKKANKEAAERRKALEKLDGIDPERYAELEKAEQDRATHDAEAKGQWDKLRVQMAENHQKDLDAERGNSGRYRTALEQHLVDAQATVAIVDAKGVPQLLLPHVKGRVKVIEQDGQFTVQVLDAQGNPMVVDAAGTPATIKSLVEHMKADPIFGRAFEGSGASGGGASSAGTRATGANNMARSAFQSLDPSAQMAHVKAGGLVTD